MIISKFNQNLFGWAKLIARGYSLACRSPWEALLVLRMAAWVVIIAGMVRVAALPRVLSILTPYKKTKVSEAELASIHFRLAQLIDRLLNFNLFVFRPTCWKRAGVLYRYLALNGIETRIVFGVRREMGELLAGHAWLEVGEGQPILEATVPDYTVTYCFPPESRLRSSGFERQTER